MCIYICILGVYMCIYIYMICISMYSTCLSIYNTPKKDTNTSRNLGTWTLWGRHHQSTIVETLFGIFFWFTTLYRVQHDGFWAFCLWPWQIWMDGWHQPTAAICSWEPLQLRFCWCVVLNEPIPNSDFSLHLRLCAWAWRVNGQHVWAVTGSPVFFFLP